MRALVQRADAEKAELVSDVVASARRLAAAQMELDVAREAVTATRIRLQDARGAPPLLLYVVRAFLTRTTRNTLSAWRRSCFGAQLAGSELHWGCVVDQLEAAVVTLSEERDELRTQGTSLKEENDELRRDLLEASKKHRQAVYAADDERKTSTKLERRVAGLEAL